MFHIGLNSILQQLYVLPTPEIVFWIGLVFECAQMCSGWCLTNIAIFQQFREIRIHYVYNGRSNTCNLWCQETMVL